MQEIKNVWVLPNAHTFKEKTARASLVTLVVWTYLPVALFEMLDKLHQICWVGDDFKVEFFY